MIWQKASRQEILNRGVDEACMSTINTSCDDGWFIETGAASSPDCVYNYIYNIVCHSGDDIKDERVTRCEYCGCIVRHGRIDCEQCGAPV